MTMNDLWILTYLVALQKDKLKPEYEAYLACEHYESWATLVEEEEESDIFMDE